MSKNVNLIQLKSRFSSSIVFFIITVMISGIVQSQSFSSIKYELNHVVKKKIKNGVIVEEKVEALTFLGTPFQYHITGLNTNTPVLRKYLDFDLMEEKQLIILNITEQGNIYLADITKVGNVFLISIFPNQKTVVVSMQYWGSYEDVVILWQGYGIYR